MNRILLFLLLGSFSFAKAQYFDWNKVIASNSGNATVRYIDYRVAPNGNQVIKYLYNPCGLCDNEIIECFADSAGNLSGCYDMFWGEYRESFFDPFSNLMQVTSAGPDYFLTYYLTDSVVIPLASVKPEFVGADVSKNIYLFFNNLLETDIKVYDSTGVLMNAFTLPGTTYRLDNNGEIYINEADYVIGTSLLRHYTADGQFVKQYPLFVFTSVDNPDFEVSSGRVWIPDANQLICYDSAGMFSYSVPLDLWTHYSVAVDAKDSLYLWNGNYIYKYFNGSLIWSTIVDAALTEKIEADEFGNIYYISNYAEPQYDINNGNFIPSSYDVPPAVAFEGYLTEPNPLPAKVHNIILGKINHADLASFNIFVSQVMQDGFPVTSLCTRKSFHVRIEYDHLPIDLADDTVYVELSDSGGGFTNPMIIGQAAGLIIHCVIPDAVGPGSGYLVRARLGNSIAMSNPYVQALNVNITPVASVLLDNSVEENYSCIPFVFKTNADTGLYYDWFTVTDPFFDPVINYLQLHDSVAVLPGPSYEAVGVMVTSNSNGCSAMSEWITPWALDSLNPLDLTLYLPDTVHVNDLPVPIYFAGYLRGEVTGQGVQVDANLYDYTFYPANASSGLIALTHTLDHTGTPCVPYEHTQYIYVNGTPRNIIVGSVEPFDKLACVGDTIDVPFNLLDPSIYDSTNVFVVELDYADPNTGKITRLAEIGSGASSPIKCVMPDIRGNNLRFTIHSTQTGERSTLNANGSISVPANPYVRFQENLLTTSCYPANTPINIYSSFGQHQWFFDNTLFLDTIGWNIGTVPVQEGQYELTVTDFDNGCTVKFGPIEVNDSAHVPALVVDPPDFYLYSCGKNFPLITALTDSASTLSWYYENTLMAFTGDSLLTDTAGVYRAVATSTAGCTIAVYEDKYVYIDPVVVTDNPPLTTICLGDSVLLSVNNNYLFFSYTYEWIKDNATSISAARQVYVSDTGSYNVVVQSSSGCTDTSAAIVVTTSTIAAPIISPQGTINILNGSVVLLSTPGLTGHTYQWYRYDVLVPGAIQPVYHTSRPGNYTVVITNADGCSSQSAIVTVTRIFKTRFIPPSITRVAVDEQEVYSAFNIYPNPSNGMFTLSGENVEEGKMHVTILDMYGRNVYNSTYISPQGTMKLEVNVDFIANGIYSLQLETRGYTISLPLVIAK